MFTSIAAGVDDLPSMIPVKFLMVNILYMTGEPLHTTSMEKMVSARHSIKLIEQISTRPDYQ